ncbi:AAA family ATPase [Pedobacter sp. N36a]|uniref:AAA family ATPase n=1 Tax=Pedobacter sp. N36a TaxID=2767996 RepID=UPI001656C48E|nr:AAA family ATPase [Pedobacter sp. N36a]MBC8988273.1 AAA family ATPase [Pedobacter sp. N36a]
MNVLEVAKELKETKENILLVYAFNTTGKTRLSVGYKNFTKSENEGSHAGVYYNAYSEDLFVWENDEENNNEGICINVKHSSLSQFHSYIDVKDVEEKLALYNPKYKFDFNLHDDPERGIESITFFVDEETKSPIKISRGEERIFVWCFFLTLFEIDEWSGTQDSHLYIDDPVSSMDEHNIFITANSIFDLIETHYLKKRIIITTHHIGLFSILFDKLKKGEKSGRYKELTKPYILKRESDKLNLVGLNKDVFLFHLHLLQTLETAIKTELFAFHFVLLRQLLENIASFLGVGRVGFTLEQIGIKDVAKTQETINALSHKNIYKQEFNKMNEEDEKIFRQVFRGIQDKYNFKY